MPRGRKSNDAQLLEGLQAQLEEMERKLDHIGRELGFANATIDMQRRMLHEMIDISASK